MKYYKADYLKVIKDYPFTKIKECDIIEGIYETWSLNIGDIVIYMIVDHFPDYSDKISFEVDIDGDTHKLNIIKRSDLDSCINGFTKVIEQLINT